MKLSGLNFVRPAALILLLSCADGFSRDVSDYAQRNADFDQPSSIEQAARQPAQSSVTPPRHPAVPTRTPSSERVVIAPIRFNTVEARAMTPFATPDAVRPAPLPSTMAAGMRPILIKPADHVVAAPRVAKYQRALGGSDTVRVGRMPAFDRNGTARLNRFVFRRTQAASAVAPAPTVHAGGANADHR